MSVNRQKRLNRIAFGFIVLVLLIVILMIQNSLRRTSHIVLPEVTTSSGQDTKNPAGSNTLTAIEITPETVQTAIATLTRPVQYARTVTIEQFWNGGSGSYEIQTSVSGNWTRLDRTLSNGHTRHSLTDGITTHIWYDSGEQVYTGPAGEFSADDEQSIPSYEEILKLPRAEISIANYQTLSQIDCIYVETVRNPAGYILRYWVCVETGLLVAAEKLQNGEKVYQMNALSVNLAPQPLERFTLPNGTVLL